MLLLRPWNWFCCICIARLKHFGHTWSRLRASACRGEGEPCITKKHCESTCDKAWCARRLVKGFHRSNVLAKNCEQVLTRAVKFSCTSRSRSCRCPRVEVRETRHSQEPRLARGQEGKANVGTSGKWDLARAAVAVVVVDGGVRYWCLFLLLLLLLLLLFLFVGDVGGDGVGCWPCCCCCCWCCCCRCCCCCCCCCCMKSLSDNTSKPSITQSTLIIERTHHESSTSSSTLFVRCFPSMTQPFPTIRSPPAPAFFAAGYVPD